MILSPDEITPLHTDDALIQSNLCNDVAFFTRDDRLIALIEHQSSTDENMPFRMGSYSFELLAKWAYLNGVDLHGKTKIQFPKVELFVAFNGKANYRYKKCQVDFGDIQVTVRYRDIHFDRLKYRGAPNTCAGYSFLLKAYEENKLKFDSNFKAMQEAANACMEKGYLLDILKDKECIAMFITRLSYEEQLQYDALQEGMQKGRQEGIQEGRQEGIQEGRQEGIQEGRQEGMQKGRQEGIQEGRQEGILFIARSMLDNDIPLDTLVEVTGLTERQIRST